MRKLIMLKYLYISLVISLIYSCTKKANVDEQPLVKVDTPASLKIAYQNYFPIGAAYNPAKNYTQTIKQFITLHYSSVTPENHFKPKIIHPSENTYKWDYADSVVLFATQNNMKVRGHTLAWYLSTPDWMVKDASGNNLSKTVFLQKLQTHINTVVGRYKNNVYCWDVVNEAISNNADPNEILRPDDILNQIAGEDYIEMAFRYARVTDPNAKLFYNDYRFSDPIKRKKIFDLIKRLKDKGTPIDGVGMQSHYIPNEITESYLQETIDMFSSLGLEIQVTELDVSVYDYRSVNSSDMNPLDDVYTTQREQIQTNTYEMLFRVYRKNKTKITGITFWGYADSRDNFRTNNIGKMDYPFLFDEFLKPKKSYYKAILF